VQVAARKALLHTAAESHTTPGTAGFAAAAAAVAAAVAVSADASEAAGRTLPGCLGHSHCNPVEGAQYTDCSC